MKNYLVQFRTGSLTYQAVQVCVEDDYIPFSDNMQKLKEMIIEQEKPIWAHASANPGGCIDITEYREEITVQELDIVSISNLDI